MFLWTIQPISCNGNLVQAFAEAEAWHDGTSKEGAARQAKFSSVASSSDDRERESSNTSEPSRSSEDLDESLQLPGPTGEQEPSDFDGSETEDSDEDPEVTSGSLREELQGVYDDWIFSLDREDRKMMAMMLYDNYITVFGIQKTAAAVEVSRLLGVSERTVRMWRQDFVSNGGEFREYGRGRYERFVVIEDGTVQGDGT